ncbi:ribosomal protein L7/L12 [Streptomyces sp. NPDC004647]|uniref:ribosomal protein L7/L12 n=1 Tax=Streptomyces sp. NPDC004647 TaxID=3154671 RepID=UPI0033B5E19D
MDIAVYLLIPLVGLLGATIERKLGRIDRRIARVERKVDLVMGHLGIRDADPEMDQVGALLLDGKKLQAIKVYREVTGAELKEAKDAVERMATRL